MKSVATLAMLAHEERRRNMAARAERERKLDLLMDAGVPLEEARTLVD